MLCRIEATTATRVRADHARLDGLHRRLGAAASALLVAPRTRLAVVAGRLHTVSPLRTLERGYAIVLDAAGNVVRSAAAVGPGDEITARVADGLITATVARASER